MQTYDNKREKTKAMTSTSLRIQSVTHTSLPSRKLKMEWMTLNFPLNSKCYSYIFYSPKTQNGMDETQLLFELKVSLIHLLFPENSKWFGCTNGSSFSITVMGRFPIMKRTSQYFIKDRLNCPKHNIRYRDPSELVSLYEMLFGPQSENMVRNARRVKERKTAKLASVHPACCETVFSI